MASINAATSGAGGLITTGDASGELQLQSNGTPTLTINTAGNVGIGTTSPAGNLHVSAAGADVKLLLERTGGSGNCQAGFKNDSGTRYMGVFGSNFHIATTSDLSASPQLTLDSSGNLALGTTTNKVTELSGAGNGLTIGGTNAPCIGIWDTSDASYLLTLGQVDASSYILNKANGSLILGTNNLEKARIDSSGNLLVGKTASNVATVGAEMRSTGRVFSTLSTNNGTDTFSLYSTAVSAYRFYVLDTGNIYATNTTITGISDQRVKENIVDLDVGLSAVMALKPRKFDWKAGKGKNIKGDRGFIAQEFETVFPDLIDTWKDPAPEGEEPYKAVRADLIPVLVKAIQEQQAIITDLKARIESLENN